MRIWPVLITLSLPCTIDGLAPPSESFLSLLVQGLIDPSIAIPGVGLPPTVPAPASAALRKVWISGPEALQEPGTEISAREAGLVFGRCDLSGRDDAYPLYAVTPTLHPILTDAFSAVLQSHKSKGVRSCLSRYDLHHGHVILEQAANLGILVVLFHSAEYPAWDSCTLNKIPLGYCQKGSTCYPSLRDWRFRNAIWASWWTVGAEHEEYGDIVHQDIWLCDGARDEIAQLRMDGMPFGRQSPNTVWEGCLGGHHIADVYCLGENVERDESSLWCSPLRSSFESGTLST